MHQNTHQIHAGRKYCRSEVARNAPHRLVWHTCTLRIPRREATRRIPLPPRLTFYHNGKPPSAQVLLHTDGGAIIYIYIMFDYQPTRTANKKRQPKGCKTLNISLRNYVRTRKGTTRLVKKCTQSGDTYLPGLVIRHPCTERLFFTQEGDKQRGVYA